MKTRKQQWINTEDKLPEVGTGVLITASQPFTTALISSKKRRGDF